MNKIVLLNLEKGWKELNDAELGASRWDMDISNDQKIQYGGDPILSV